MTEIFQAIQAGDIAAIKQQIDREPSIVHAQDASGVHALAHAAMAGKTDVVRELLAHGADPRVVNDPAVHNDSTSEAYALVREAALSADTRDANQSTTHKSTENSGSHLPPPEVARLIPCKFYPNCRYGDRCVFQHPTGPVGDLPQPVFFSGPGIPFPPPGAYGVPPPFVDMPPVFPMYGAGGVPFFPQMAPQTEEPKGEQEEQAPAESQSDEPAARPRKGGKPKGGESTRGRAPTTRSSCVFFARTACRYANECRFPHILPDGTDARLKDDDKTRSRDSPDMSSSGTSTPRGPKKAGSIRGRGGSAVRGKPRRGGAPANPRKPVQRVPNSDEFPALPGATPPRQEDERSEPKANFSAILSAPAPKRDTRADKSGNNVEAAEVSAGAPASDAAVPEAPAAAESIQSPAPATPAPPSNNTPTTQSFTNNFNMGMIPYPYIPAHDPYTYSIASRYYHGYPQAGIPMMGYPYNPSHFAHESQPVHPWNLVAAQPQWRAPAGGQGPYPGPQAYPTRHMDPMGPVGSVGPAGQVHPDTHAMMPTQPHPIHVTPPVGMPNTNMCRESDTSTDTSGSDEYTTPPSSLAVNKDIPKNNEGTSHESNTHNNTNNVKYNNTSATHDNSNATRNNTQRNLGTRNTQSNARPTTPPTAKTSGSSDGSPVYARNEHAGIEQCTVFIAGLPSGSRPTKALQDELVVFLGELAPVRQVKLVNDNASGCVKCVFAEFETPEHASKAAALIGKTPFQGAFLRMEPARGERTVRFSRISSTDTHIHHQYVLLRGSVDGQDVYGPYDPQCSVDHQGVLFSPIAVEDIASRFGRVEQVSEDTPDHVDVVFSRRPDAVAAVRHLGMLAPQSNLRVRWRRGGRVFNEPSQRFNSSHVPPPDPTWLYNAADAYANHLRNMRTGAH
ncbi:hypothetical protein MCUN1_000327 [Malassezia cuniculi]|uniref:Ankyrin repeat protein n=1 Tax=Malassezia cuniculi TaxID=948313 RepID=A0AAF0EQV2_9BASI|nr:hypothetical protein MCUN1_000327 [Malassezia cuniculi]